MYIEIEKLSTRIKELGDKSTQLLLFLSFAFVAVVSLRADHALTIPQQDSLTMAMRFWVWALLPILAGILPVKDIAWENSRWYNILRLAKIVLLWTAIVLILVGGIYFGLGIWPIGHAAGGLETVPLE